MHLHHPEAEVPKSTVLVDVGHRLSTTSLNVAPRRNWAELRHYLQRLQGQRFIDQLRACSRHEKVVITGALVQATIVAMLQALILSLGDFKNLDSSRRSYIFFFFFTCFGGLLQALYGILSVSLTELSAALMLNVLSVIYASLQVSEVYTDREKVESTVGILAAVSCAVLVIIVFVDSAVVAHLYEKFADTVHTRVGSDPAIHRMYHNYKAMAAVSTLLTLLNTVFVFVHFVIYLPAGDDEMPALISFLIFDIALAVSIRVMKSFYTLMRVYLCWLVVLSVAYLYKVVVFDFRSCSFCQNVSNMLFLSFSAMINLVLCITALGLTVRCITTFQEELTQSLGMNRNMFSKPANPLPLANQRFSSKPDHARPKAKPAFVTSEFRFQRVSSHRSQLASMVDAGVHVQRRLLISTDGPISPSNHKRGEGRRRLRHGGDSKSNASISTTGSSVGSRMGLLQTATDRDVGGRAQAQLSPTLQMQSEA